MYKAFPVSELRRHISGDVNREYEEGFVEVDLDPTSPDDIRVIGSSRSRPVSRRNSSNVPTGPNSPQRQDSDRDLGPLDNAQSHQQNGISPSYSPSYSPQGKLIQIRVDSLSNPLQNHDGSPQLGGVIVGGGGGGGGAIEMMELQHLDSPTQRGFTPFHRFPSDSGLPPVSESQSSVFGKRKLNLLDKNVPVSDSEAQ